MIAHYKDVDAQCGEAVDAEGKLQSISIAHRAGPYHAVTLVFNRAKHDDMHEVARMLNRLGLNEVRVE